jgi:hypothetical protein
MMYAGLGSYPIVNVVAELAKSISLNCNTIILANPITIIESHSLHVRDF